MRPNATLELGRNKLNKDYGRISTWKSLTAFWLVVIQSHNQCLASPLTGSDVIHFPTGVLPPVSILTFVLFWRSCNLRFSMSSISITQCDDSALLRFGPQRSLRPDTKYWTTSKSMTSHSDNERSIVLFLGLNCKEQLAEQTVQAQFPCSINTSELHQLALRNSSKKTDRKYVFNYCASI